MNNETILPCSFCGEVRELLKDARHRIANLSRAAVPFDDPLDGPVLRRLDAALAAQPATSADLVAYGIKAVNTGKISTLVLAGSSEADELGEYRPEHIVPLYAAPAAAQRPTMNDATAAGDGTLHGAIDHWQTRALEAEGKLSTSAEPSDEEIEALAHRVCTKYTHADDPSASRYEFGMRTLRQFARTLLSRYGDTSPAATPDALRRKEND